MQDDSIDLQSKYQITTQLLLPLNLNQIQEDKIKEECGIDVLLDRIQMNDKCGKYIIEILQYATEIQEVRLKVIEKKGIDILVRVVLFLIQQE